MATRTDVDITVRGLHPDPSRAPFTQLPFEYVSSIRVRAHRKIARHRSPMRAGFEMAGELRR